MDKNKNVVLVNNRQKGNPILNYIKNVPWQFATIVPDFIVGETSCVMYLSLRYHQLNSNYIHERLSELGKSFDLRVLILQIDIKDPEFYIKELTKITTMSDFTMMLAWSLDEAGRYIETYKAYEYKPPDILMAKDDKVANEMVNFYEEIDPSNKKNFIPFVNVLLSSKCLNKTDCQTLYKAFYGNLSKLIKIAIEEENTLELYSGIGPSKASKLKEIFSAKFASL